MTISANLSLFTKSDVIEEYSLSEVFRITYSNISVKLWATSWISVFQGIPSEGLSNLSSFQFVDKFYLICRQFSISYYSIKIDLSIDCIVLLWYYNNKTKWIWIYDREKGQYKSNQIYILPWKAIMLLLSHFLLLLSHFLFHKHFLLLLSHFLLLSFCHVSRAKIK